MNLGKFLRVQMGLEDNVVWKGNSKQTSTSTSTPLQTPQYKNLLNQADQWLGGGGFSDQYYGGQDLVANMTPEQQQAIQSGQQLGSNLSDVYNGQGTQSLQNFLGAYDPSKTGLTNAINASNEALNWDYATSVAPQIRQGSTNAGQYGSTRAGVAEGIAQARLGQQKQNAANQLAFQDQQAYNQNQLNALGNLQNITRGLASGSTLGYDLGSLQQNQQQREIDADLQRWAYENNVDLNNLLAYKELISGDMGGKTTATTKGGGGGGLGSALGSLGGAALGGYFGGPSGAMAGSSVGGQTGGLLLG